MRKLVAITVCALLVGAIALAGCGKKTAKGEGASAPGSKPAASAKTE